MRSIMDLVRTAGLRRVNNPHAPVPSPPSPGPSGPNCLVRLQSWPWWRPLLRSVWTVLVVSGLAWLGARSAQSEGPVELLDEPDPVLAGMLTGGSAMTVSGTHHPTDGGVTDGSENGSEARESANDSGVTSDTAPPPKRGVLDDGRVVLNVANATELCSLPGIGPSRANAIITLRDRLGRFRSMRQLLRVRGIGPKTLKRLEPKLVLDAPSDTGGAAASGQRK